MIGKKGKYPFIPDHFNIIWKVFSGCRNFFCLQK